MGSNNNKNQQQQQQNPGYGPNPGRSGDDPRGRSQNLGQYQMDRFESQQGPMVNAFAHNYGRGSESDFGNYTDMMNQYRDIYSGGGGGLSYDDIAGGGGGGGGYSAFTVNPERVSWGTVTPERIASRALGPLERVQAQKLNPLERVNVQDPFESYKGFQEFSQTGGYSPQDIANMRARGISPIRAAYANAERNIGQQRSLQGGYSPNAIAAQVRMAREQGQGMADAAQNVEAGIAQARNQGRLAGYGGMSNIEQARLQSQLDQQKFNAAQAMAGNQFDISNRLQGDIYNAGQAFQGQQFDIGNELEAARFNAGQGLQAGMFNVDTGLKGGMFNSEQAMKAGMYNADAQARAQAQNIGAANAAAAARAQAQAASNADRLRALSGATNLYGTTPGMSQLFGNQLLQGVGQGANFGLGMMGAEAQAQGLPGAWDQTMGRIGDVTGMGGYGTYPWLPNEQESRRRTTGGG